jgi:pyrroloquinoline quinone (PQQ) biosynthesis protein C
VHIGEERRHEQLCIHDLKAIERSIDDFEERHATRMFYEPQYYKVEHQAPIVLFGYILPLEAIGPLHGARILPRIRGAHGERSIAFLKLHAEEDVEHLDKALDMLSDVPKAEQTLILQNMAQTTHGYTAVLDAIRTRA